MKKKLEADLMSIAHRILKLKGKDNLDQMHKEVVTLYEKLTVLKFAKENFDKDLPTIGSDSSFFGMLDVAFNNKVSDNIEFENRTYVNMDDREHDDIMEPAIEKIKDMVAQMPQEAEHIEAAFNKAVTKMKPHKNDFDYITSGFNNMPEFEPVTNSNKKEDTKKSLNDKLKTRGLQIGLNDKLVFIKHLFNGEANDYNRVLSQINTASSFDEAENLVQNVVKPDYNNWKGKEDVEFRFMEIIESKFN